MRYCINVFHSPFAQFPPSHAHWSTILARSEKNGPIRPDSQDDRLHCGQQSPGSDPLTSSLVLSCPGKKAF